MNRVITVPAELNAQSGDAEYLVLRWKYSAHLESFYAAYKLVKKNLKYRYVMVELELVHAHWGIQLGCYGSWDYEEKILSKYKTIEKSHKDNFLSSFKDPSKIFLCTNLATHNETLKSIRYDLEENSLLDPVNSNVILYSIS